MSESKSSGGGIKCVDYTQAGEGARKGDMSAEETIQCVADISNWFTNKAADVVLAAGAGEADMKRLVGAAPCEVPMALKKLLQVHDGGFPVCGESALMSAGDICDALSSTAGGEALNKAAKIPFAKDFDEDYLVAGADGVFECTADGSVGDNLASSFEAFLEQFRNDLLSNKFEYIDGCGLVETAAGGGAPAKK